MPDPYLVDSHCHIPLVEAPGGAAAVIQAARDAGVGHLLCVSIDLETYPQVRELAESWSCVSASVGVHPNHPEGDAPLTAAALVREAAHPAVVAVGETGLDYFRSQGDTDWQRRRFRVHIQAAREIGKPLIIHSRAAREDVINILAAEKADSVGGVMHCFVDDLDTARRAMDLNFRISFSGIVTFKNAQNLQAVVAQIPLDNMLVETDSPYLAPVPHRGKQNQPAYVRLVAEKIAQLQQVELDEVVSATTRNYENLFGGAGAAE